MSSADGQHVEELDRRALRQLHVGLHAAAGVQHQAEVHGRARVASAVREILEGLWLAVLEDLEILFRQVGDDVALAVGDGHGEGGEIDAGAELLVYPPEGGHHSVLWPEGGHHSSAEGHHMVVTAIARVGLMTLTELDEPCGVRLSRMTAIRRITAISPRPAVIGGF